MLVSLEIKIVNTFGFTREELNERRVNDSRICPIRHLFTSLKRYAHLISAMAEAHQAVSYSELIKHEPTNKYHQLEVLMLVWQSGVRSWKKRIGRFKSEVKNGVYPAHIETLWILIGVTTAIHFSGKSIPFDLVNTFLKIAPE